ncbi:MAG TPA: 50S ribosomal protein L1 [Abditibacteriaceae bacterium]|nr:50S ribosomal protein L1 [Abditibacteriaceae bacterium]
MATKNGKRYRALAEKIDSSRPYALPEAVDLIKGAATAKFDETVDVTIVLGIDPRKGDQQVRGTLSLPHGTGKTPRVVAIAKGEAATAAESAGADAVGAEELIAQIENDEVQFDVLVATPDMMRAISRLGKKLGPRMPNAKSGTVGPDLGRIVADRKKGQIEYRNEPKAGVVHSVIGKASFEAAALQENCTALVDALQRAKPATAKGTYLKSVTLSSTMGPGVKVDPTTIKH